MNDEPKAVRQLTTIFVLFITPSFIVPSPSFASDLAGLQVPIPPAFRVFNASGRQCVYCSLETLARYAGMANLTDLTETYRTEADPDRVGRLLTRRGVRYVMQMPGDKRTDLLAQAVALEHRGAAVGLRGRHMVVVVHWSPQAGEVKILSNLKPSREVQTIPLAEFLQLWDGWTVVLYKISH